LTLGQRKLLSRSLKLLKITWGFVHEGTHQWEAYLSYAGGRKSDRCWRCIFASNFKWISKRTNPLSSLLPSTVNPRYRIRGTMCNARINLIKPRTLIFEMWNLCIKFKEHY
jgi:hypothetical protein